MQYFFPLTPGTASRPSRGGRSRSGERLACRGDKCSVPMIPPVVDTMFSLFSAPRQGERWRNGDYVRGSAGHGTSPCAHPGCPGSSPPGYRRRDSRPGGDRRPEHPSLPPRGDGRVRRRLDGERNGKTVPGGGIGQPRHGLERKRRRYGLRPDHDRCDGPGAVRHGDPGVRSSFPRERFSPPIMSPRFPPSAGGRSRSTGARPSRSYRPATSWSNRGRRPKAR